MNKVYLTSPDSGNYLMKCEDGEVLSCFAGSDLAGCNEESYFIEFYLEHQDYEIMTEEQFKEWETKALMMRELTEIIDDEPKSNLTFKYDKYK